MKKEIKRIACSDCNGTGSFEQKSPVVCKKCTGRGWFGEPNLEVVCTDCFGTGEVEKISKSGCKPCSSRGHFIKIVEIKKLRRKCTKCPDNDDPDDYDWVDCDACNGTGYDSVIQTCSRCRGEGTLEGWFCSYCSGTGGVQVEDKTYSESSHYLNEKPCRQCEGIGQVSKPPSCEHCSGKGYVYATVEKDVTPNVH